MGVGSHIGGGAGAIYDAANSGLDNGAKVAIIGAVIALTVLGIFLAVLKKKRQQREAEGESEVRRATEYTRLAVGDYAGGGGGDGRYPRSRDDDVEAQKASPRIEVTEYRSPMAQPGTAPAAPQAFLNPFVEPGTSPYDPPSAPPRPPKEPLPDLQQEQQQKQQQQQAVTPPWVVGPPPPGKRRQAKAERPESRESGEGAMPSAADRRERRKSLSRRSVDGGPGVPTRGSRAGRGVR
jgi:hypothetical protein